MDKLVKASVFLSYPNIWNLFFFSSFETSAFNRIVNKSSTESWCSLWYYFWWWILRNAIATSIQFVGIIASTQKQNEDETDVLSYTQFPFKARARSFFPSPCVIYTMMLPISIVFIFMALSSQHWEHCSLFLSFRFVIIVTIGLVIW